MNRLVRTELLKQRTTRTFVAGICAAPAVAALVTIAILSAAGTQGNDPLGPDSLVHVIGGPAAVITLIAALLGVLGTAGEYRHQTITTTFLAAPPRRDVVVAKLAAHSLTGALMGLLSFAVSVAIAVPWLQASGVDVYLDGEAVRVAAGLVASTALYGALGVSIGALLRNQTTAAASLLVWLLAVEGLIGDLVHGAAFVQWLPAAAGLFALYIVGFAAAATRLTVDRDVT